MIKLITNRLGLVGILLAVLTIVSCASQSGNQNVHVNNNSSANRINAPGYMFK